MTSAGAPGRATPSSPTRAGEEESRRPARDWLHAVESTILRTAAEHIARDWKNELGEALDEAEFRAELSLLLQTIETDASLPEWTPETTASLILRRRLLDLLRAELIRLWSAPDADPAAADMVELLQGIEAAHTHLEPPWDMRFSSHLAAPGGLELVVEMAHDLRSPLTSIMFLSETLRNGQSGDVNDMQRRQLGIVYSAALALTNIVSDVIDLARDKTRLVDPEPSPFSVTELLQRVFDIVRPMAEEKGLDVRISPPATDRRLGHPAALSRILLNLTTNAIKFTDEGGVELSVNSRGRSRLEFSVRDTGRGIDPEVMNTLYQPIRRTGARKGYYFSGSGMGLAIVRRLIEALGSTLQVETDPEWGTRFYFELELPSAGAL